LNVVVSDAGVSLFLISRAIAEMFADFKDNFSMSIVLDGLNCSNSNSSLELSSYSLSSFFLLEGG
jgi:hypothetical protein